VQRQLAGGVSWDLDVMGPGATSHDTEGLNALAASSADVPKSTIILDVVDDWSEPVLIGRLRQDHRHRVAQQQDGGFPLLSVTSEYLIAAQHIDTSQALECRAAIFIPDGRNLSRIIEPDDRCDRELGAPREHELVEAYEYTDTWTQRRPPSVHVPSLKRKLSPSNALVQLRAAEYPSASKACAPQA
jgi:hypothetical protein